MQPITTGQVADTQPKRKLFLARSLVTGAMALPIAGLWACSREPPQPSAALPKHVTEADFQASAVVTDELNDVDRAQEWHGVRADHRLIVNAILSCKKRL